jgi:hypothetical protein
MSYTTLYAINSAGEPVQYATYQNSHGSAPAVWDILIAAYVPNGKPLDWNMDKHNFAHPMPKHWLFNSSEVFGTINERIAKGDIPDRDAVVYYTTLDSAAVKIADLPYLVQHMQDFATWWAGPMRGRAFSIAAQAEDIQNIYKTHEAEGWIGVCWCQTSLSEDRWVPSFDEEDEEENEGKPYNFHTGDLHTWFDRNTYRTQ